MSGYKYSDRDAAGARGCGLSVRSSLNESVWVLPTSFEGLKHFNAPSRQELNTVVKNLWLPRARASRLLSPQFASRETMRNNKTRPKAHVENANHIKPTWIDMND